MQAATELVAPELVSEEIAPAPPSEFDEFPDDLADSLYHLSVEQYHAMAEAGIFADDERVELLDGRLFRKMTKHPPHTFANDELYDLLLPMLPSGWIIRAQQPITLDKSEPEPDLAIVKGVRRTYLKRHPDKNEIAFVVEISDTTVRTDRGLKSQVYAEATIAEYWLIAVPQRQVEVYTQPKGTGAQATYAEKAIYKPGDMIPVRIGGQEVGQIGVADLFE